jgi:hypothetical protein
MARRRAARRYELSLSIARSNSGPATDCKRDQRISSRSLASSMPSTTALSSSSSPSTSSTNEQQRPSKSSSVPSSAGTRSRARNSHISLIGLKATNSAEPNARVTSSGRPADRSLTISTIERPLTAGVAAGRTSGGLLNLPGSTSNASAASAARMSAASGSARSIESGNDQRVIGAKVAASLMSRRPSNAPVDLHHCRDVCWQQTPDGSIADAARHPQPLETVNHHLEPKRPAGPRQFCLRS